MIIQATFKGQNGSLGYSTGKPYTLTVRELRGIIVVERPGGVGRCVYTSVFAFLRNWSTVTAA